MTCRTHEGQEEGEERPAGAPQGDFEGRRREGRRIDVGRGSAAATRSGSSAGLLAHHDHEVVALLRTAGDAAGRGTGTDSARGRERQAAGVGR